MVWVISILFFAANQVGASTSAPVDLSQFIKPHLWKRMVENREILLNAKLETLASRQTAQLIPRDQPQAPIEKRYSFYTAMRVNEHLQQTRQILTDYKIYSKLIPYIDKAVYSDSSHLLDLEGGIWKFRLASQLLFEQPSENQIRFKVVEGHFTGLTGNIYFEKNGEGTVVYLQGEQTGTVWPPQWIIERGAEVVFEYTASHMRSYIETQKTSAHTKGTAHGQKNAENNGVPQPKSRISLW